MKRFYFDYNATTPLAPPARDVLTKCLKQDFKNPSSSHLEGRQAKEQLESSRKRMALHLGCEPEEIIFTSGATEANNRLLFSVWESRPSGRDQIVTTPIEHDSVSKPLELLKQRGAKIQTVECDQRGQLNLSQLESLLDEKTLLISVMLANNETGIFLPVQKIAKLAKKKGALVHTDAVCVIGKHPVSFRELDVDFLSLSGHKFYSPKGIGALLVRKGTNALSPLLFGGAQEAGQRSGTENLYGILAMASALDFSLNDVDTENKRQFDLRNGLKKGLLAIDKRILFHEGPGDQLPGTLNVAFPEISGQTLLARLDLEGVAASYGSACHSGSLNVSRVLLAMGIKEKEALGSIRISFGRMTTEGEVDGLLEIFGRVLQYCA